MIASFLPQQKLKRLQKILSSDTLQNNIVLTTFYYLKNPDMVFKSFFKRFYLFIFREKGREGEREGEKHQCVVGSPVSPTGDLGPQPRHVP